MPYAKNEGPYQPVYLRSQIGVFTVCRYILQYPLRGLCMSHQMTGVGCSELLLAFENLAVVEVIVTLFVLWTI